MGLWTVLSCIFFLLCVGGNSAGSPGAVLFSSLGLVPTYNTKTLDETGVSTYLSERLSSESPEVVVLLSMDHASAAPVMSTTKVTTTTLSSVYASAGSASDAAPVKRAILATKGMGAATKMSPSKFLEEVVRKQDAAVWSNGKTDTIELVLKGEESERKAMEEISATAAKNSGALFIALREPKGVAPQNSVHYSRVLASSSNILDGIYYKPEGAEYSIYYASTYLYLTPDIFTGILSGLFFLFVVLTGVSCLGAIQGPSSFTHKEGIPAIGREN